MAIKQQDGERDGGGTAFSARPTQREETPALGNTTASVLPADSGDCEGPAAGGGVRTEAEGQGWRSAHAAARCGQGAMRRAERAAARRASRWAEVPGAWARGPTSQMGAAGEGVEHTGAGPSLTVCRRPTSVRMYSRGVRAGPRGLSGRQGRCLAPFCAVLSQKQDGGLPRVVKIVQVFTGLMEIKM